MKFFIRQLFKMTLQHIILPIVYFLNRWRRIDDGLVVLADAHHNSCPPDMLCIRDKLRRRKVKLTEFYFDTASGSRINSALYMIRFMRLYATAKKVYLCDYFLPVGACRKRKGTMVIQLWHGCGAFKRFGFDAADDIPSYYKGNVHKNYDLVTVSGASCTKAFAGAMGIEEDIVRGIGVAATDRLFDGDYLSYCRDRFRYEYPDAIGKKVILWAPTFRGNANAPQIEGEEIIDEAFGRINIEGEYYLIKSLHPHLMKGKAPAPMSTEELMVCADVLITDYSSIFFEYLLLDKPIIFFASDYVNYTEKRGFYLDYKELPGTVITDDNIASNEDSLCVDLCNAIRDNTDEADNYGCDRRAYRLKYMDGCDGHATERILDYE
ncbi:MAG: CDP-glycerol glycerophosphotransferase family protein [Wujia sp.]